MKYSVANKEVYIQSICCAQTKFIHLRQWYYLTDKSRASL